jgi:hypothetical protein
MRLRVRQQRLHHAFQQMLARAVLELVPERLGLALKVAATNTGHSREAWSRRGPRGGSAPGSMVLPWPGRRLLH